MMSENMARSSKQHFIVWIAAVISGLALAGYFFMRTVQDCKSVSPLKRGRRSILLYNKPPLPLLFSPANPLGRKLRRGVMEIDPEIEI